jgi:hypothetical protein
VRSLRSRLEFLGAASAVIGAALLLFAPFLPLVRDPVAVRLPSPRMGAVRPGPLENTLFWQTPITDWLPFVVAAVAAVFGLALSDRGSRRARLFVVCVGTAALLWSARVVDSGLLAACNLPGLSGVTYHDCDPRLLPALTSMDPGAGLLAAEAGAVLIVLGGVALLFARPLPASIVEQRRRRIRSALWI